MFNSLKVALAVASSMVVVASAGAQTSGQPASQAKAAGNPSEVVCEKQTVVGSRLAVRRVCMTRQQWAEQKLLDRQDTEKTQSRIDQTPAG